MEKIVVKGKLSNSDILVGETITNLSAYLPPNSIFIITDSNILNHFKAQFPQYPTYTIAPGEVSKSLTEAGNICSWLLEMGADRNSFILGVGGGVVCDLAGFVASTYMRGVDFGFVSTTLLSQVDASVGGKNGVNLEGFKNIIGTFNQPKFVICDTEMLQTLSKDEFTNGFAEIVKHALIADAEMFTFLEKNAEELKSRNSGVIDHLVLRSVQIKAQIIQADEREKGERKKLNLGHTFGHAVEKIAKLPHGKSVSIGLGFAAHLSVSKNLLDSRDYLRIMNLLRDLGLPICTEVNPNIIFEALAKDKKKTSNEIDFVLLNGVGNVTIQRISLDEIQNFMISKQK